MNLKMPFILKQEGGEKSLKKDLRSFLWLSFSSYHTSLTAFKPQSDVVRTLLNKPWWFIKLVYEDIFSLYSNSDCWFIPQFPVNSFFICMRKYLAFIPERSKMLADYFYFSYRVRLVFCCTFWWITYLVLFVILTSLAFKISHSLNSALSHIIFFIAHIWIFWPIKWNEVRVPC